MTDRSSTRNGELEQRPWWAFGCGPHLTPTDLRNSRRLTFLTLAWAVVFLVCLYALTRWEAFLGVWQYPLAALPPLFLLAVIGAFVRFIRQADELTRKIQLESLAIGFGAGLWFVFTWGILEQVGVPKLDISDSIIAMVLAYAVNVTRMHRRYS